MTKVEFLRPRFIGARYNDGAIPIDVLKEWSALEAMTLDLAKDLWKQDNPRAKRAPKGFGREFALFLSGVEGGSSVPIIQRPDSAFGPYYDRARQLILATMIAAAAGTAWPNEITGKYIPRFDKLGSALRDDERVELAAEGTTAVFDRSVQKAIVLKSGAEYTVMASVLGRVDALDTANLTFRMTLLNGIRLDGRMSRDQARRLQTALVPPRAAHEREGVLTHIFGLVSYDSADKPFKIRELDGVEVLEPGDVSGALFELTYLTNGWMDGHGTAPNKEGLTWLADKWNTRLEGELPRVYVYPTVDGDVQLEWSVAPYEVSAEVALASRRAEVMRFDTRSGEARQEPLNLEEDASWERLLVFLRSPAAL